VIGNFDKDPLKDEFRTLKSRTDDWKKGGNQKNRAIQVTNIEPLDQWRVVAFATDETGMYGYKQIKIGCIVRIFYVFLVSFELACLLLLIWVV